MAWDRQCLEDYEQKDDSMNQLMTKVFIEHPWLHQVCYLLACKLMNLKWLDFAQFWLLPMLAIQPYNQ